MADAEQTLGKPVLLEEFGKRLIKGTDAQLFEDAIDHLRNPVFKTTYDLVTAAIQMCDPCSFVRSWCVKVTHVPVFFRECYGGVSMHLRQKCHMLSFCNKYKCGVKVA